MKLFEIKNKPAPWLLVEAAEGKNTHLEHLEDEILNSGYAGAQLAFSYLENLRTMLSKGTGTPQAKVTVKWDGAPAIICGIDPADGKFFLGTKSVFSQDAKLIKSKKDIANWYSDKPDLAEKLMYALKYLPELGIGNVLQGDLMFTKPNLGVASIGGEDCYVFTPNTISYAVPVNSQLGQRLAASQIGIVFHTAYEGASLPEMTASFGVSVAGLNKSKNVWFDDATYKDLTGRATLSSDEDRAFKKAIDGGIKTLQKIDKKKFDIIIQNQEFAKYVKPFINNRIRGGEQVGEPITFLKEFLVFYKGKMEAEMAKLKGGPESKAAQDRMAKIQQQERFIADNSNTLLGIMAIYKRVIELKLAIVKKLQQVESMVGTFLKTETGYQVMNPEGFVAVGHDGGAVKLIDRLEFSRQNFAGKADWKRTSFEPTA
jgi:hypothetical protein